MGTGERRYIQKTSSSTGTQILDRESHHHSHHHPDSHADEWLEGSCTGARRECSQGEHKTALDANGQVEPTGAESPVRPLHLAIRRSQTEPPTGRGDNHRAASGKTGADAGQSC